MKKIISLYQENEKFVSLYMRNDEKYLLLSGPWAPHGSDWFSCNKYVEDAEHIAMLSKERKAMERYHHYYDRLMFVPPL